MVIWGRIARYPVGYRSRYNIEACMTPWGYLRELVTSRGSITRNSVSVSNCLSLVGNQLVLPSSRLEHSPISWMDLGPLPRGWSVRKTLGRMRGSPMPHFLALRKGSRPNVTLLLLAGSCLLSLSGLCLTRHILTS